MIFEQLARVVFGSYPKVTTENALLTNAEKQFKAVGRSFEMAPMINDAEFLIVSGDIVKLVLPLIPAWGKEQFAELTEFDYSPCREKCVEISGKAPLWVYMY